MLTGAMARRITLDFLRTERGSGVVLVVAAAAAIGLANSRWAPDYFAFIGAPFTIQLGGFRETRTVLEWAREGLMAVFFFVLGLEIKYEIFRGELANPRRLALPGLAALGGIVGPALAFLAFNWGPGGEPQAWPAPVATDMAFALAALAAAGPKLPATLRVFVLTLAIADNLAAVALMGLTFAGRLHLAAAGGALVALALMAMLGRWRQAPYLLYALGLLLVWAFTLKSGISPAAGCAAAAATIPLTPRKPGRPGVLEDFMESLHPYVAYLILPFFAFAAAGFAARGVGLSDLFGPVALGVAAGLAIGKPLGVFGAASAVIGLKLARRPTGMKWIELAGVSMLCGAGFTMSLFVGQLAFPDSAGAAQAQARLGVMAGSLAATLVGMALLAWAQARRGPE
jgi:NhaA family Na+:H+ antiporter